uniref:Uncharacterized protein n=1 Tax=viral metagenome TaxID=1070528 RepID=A0A6C0EUM8_9ZZZZ
MEGCVLPLDYKYSKFLFYTSFLFEISFLFAIYLSNYYAIFYWFMLFFSSTNHWKNADYGIKRKFDLLIVFIGFLNTIGYMFILPNEFYKKMCLFVFLCIIFFDIAERLCCYFNSTKWIIFHMTIHIYVFIMSLFMFV